MLYALGIVAMILGIVVSVALHEVGHMVPAKKFGAIVARYMVGFGPTLWSRTVNGTEYGLKAILLGGYVSILGMYRKANPNTVVYKDSARHRYTQAEADRMSPAEVADLKPTMAQQARLDALEQLEETEAPGRPFYELTWWRKAIVMFSGPFVNLILSFIFLAIALCGIGYQMPTTTIASVEPCLAAQGSCQAGDAKSAAAQAGIERGDQIVAWNGHSVSTWDEVRHAIADTGEHQARVTYVRDGQRHTASITPQVVQGQTLVGFTSQMSHHRGDLGEVMSDEGKMMVGTAGVIVRLPQQLWQTVSDIIHHQPRPTSSVMSVVGVARISGEIASTPNTRVTAGDRVGSFLSLMASLNMALFVFNVIPLLPLDGGHILGAFYEGARRRLALVRGKPDPGPSDSARMMPFVAVVWSLLIIMTVILIVADIVNPVRLG